MADPKQRKELVIHFDGEQDGESERRLRLALSKLFASGKAVQRAYLVRVRYGNETVTDVALALVAPPGSRDQLVAAVQATFYSLFSIGQHLDIFFPSTAQEAEISLVCHPFFTA